MAVDAHDVMTATLNSGKEWAGADSAVSDLLDALNAAGYAVVPKEPTEARILENEQAMRQTLRALDHATPRNGAVYVAADILRKRLGLNPMTVGGSPSDGV